MNVVYIPDPQPFWFVESALLAGLLRAEIAKVKTLGDQHAHLEGLFDSPDANEISAKAMFPSSWHTGRHWKSSPSYSQADMNPSPLISEGDSKIYDLDSMDWPLVMRLIGC